MTKKQNQELHLLSTWTLQNIEPWAYLNSLRDAQFVIFSRARCLQEYTQGGTKKIKEKCKGETFSTFPLYASPSHYLSRIHNPIHYCHRLKANS